MSNPNDPNTHTDIRWIDQRLTDNAAQIQGLEQTKSIGVPEFGVLYDWRIRTLREVMRLLETVRADRLAAIKAAE